MHVDEAAETELKALSESFDRPHPSILTEKCGRSIVSASSPRYVVPISPSPVLEELGSLPKLDECLLVNLYL